MSDGKCRVEKNSKNIKQMNMSLGWIEQYFMPGSEKNELTLLTTLQYQY